jgi:hypothetical protein
MNELKNFATFKGQNFCSLVGHATKNDDEDASTLKSRLSSINFSGHPPLITSHTF